jgi:chaperonin GroEL (HSP60 family)
VVDPNDIIDGYTMAMKKAIEILRNISETLTYADKRTLKRIAIGAMATKLARPVAERLADLTLQAIDYLRVKVDDRYDINLDNLKIVGKLGGSVVDSQFFEGVIVDGEMARSDMPRRLLNATIALVAHDIKIELPPGGRVVLDTVEKLKDAIRSEKEIIEARIKRLADLGVTCVFTQGIIDEAAKHYMAKMGMMGIEKVSRSDILKLANATGATPVFDIDDVTAGDIGSAGFVEERVVATLPPGVETARERWGSMIFVGRVPNKQACTILVRGATQPIIDEAIASLSDAIYAVRNVLIDNRYVPGGGCAEIEIARRIRTNKHNAETLANIIADVILNMFSRS